MPAPMSRLMSWEMGFWDRIHLFPICCNKILVDTASMLPVVGRFKVVRVFHYLDKSSSTVPFERQQ